MIFLTESNTIPGVTFVGWEDLSSGAEFVFSMAEHSENNKVVIRNKKLLEAC